MRRIVLSILVALALAACVPARVGADDQPGELAADAGAAGGIGTSPAWPWPFPWPCPGWLCVPGPTDTTGLAGGDAG